MISLTPSYRAGAIELIIVFDETEGRSRQWNHCSTRRDESALQRILIGLFEIAAAARIGWLLLILS